MDGPGVLVRNAFEEGVKYVSIICKIWGATPFAHFLSKNREIGMGIMGLNLDFFGFLSKIEFYIENST